MAQPTILYCVYDTAATATISLVGNGVTTPVLAATEDQYYAPLSTDSFNIVIDQGAANAISAFSLLGAYMDGVTVEVRGSTDNFSASDESVSAAAALTSDVNSAWRSFTEVSYQYIKLIFTGHPTNLRVAHVCLSDYDLFPHFETDPDFGNFTPTGIQIISQSGIYNGSNQQKSMRMMNINWGQLSPAELPPVEAWANATVKVMRAFTIVPDTAETESYFCWQPDGGQYKAPLRTGINTVSNFTIETRAV